MQLNTTNLLLVLLGGTLILCFILMLINKDNEVEPFDPVIDTIQTQLQGQTPEQLKDTIKTIQQRLIDYGYAPDLNNYVKKTELSPDTGKCTVSTAEDRDKYISKSDIPPPGPRVDLSQYVKKSSIPPEKVCPSVPEIDYSQYVKKSTLPPAEKCPPCIAPKVKVSAGLCRECPPPPPCPAPQACPELRCPEPKPCPTQPECPKCDEVRYIKVPAVITKTVMIDQNGNVISQQIDSGNITPSGATNTTIPATANQSNSILNSIYGKIGVMEAALMPSTTFPATVPNTTLAQELAKPTETSKGTSFCPTPDLNSEFKSYGIYGP